MRGTRPFAAYGLTCALLLAGALVAARVVAATHEAAGRTAGAADFPGLATLCDAPSPKVDAALVRSRPWRMPEPVAATRVFDNLYFLGNREVSAWAIRTSRGIILVDALSNGAEALRYIERGMQSLGLDPRDIRILLISHGHGDHYGGAGYIVRRHRPQVLISATDAAMLKDPAQRIDAPGWDSPPEPTRTLARRDVVELGDTRVESIETPGHTPGTVSLLFEVRDGSRRHTAILWGGTGFNFGPDVARYRAYADAAEATRVEALARGVDVFLSNHVRRDEADRKIELLRARKPDEPHPFVLPPERTARAFEVFRECALAQIDKLQGAGSAAPGDIPGERP